MVHRRARTRWLSFLSLSSLLAISILTACSAPNPDSKEALERLGYKNVTVLEPEGSVRYYSATVNGCEIHLVRAQHSGEWIVSIQKTADGRTLKEQSYQDGAGVIFGVGNAKDLAQKEQTFIGFCPPSP